MKIAVKENKAVLSGKTMDFVNGKLKVDGLLYVDCDDKNTKICNIDRLPENYIDGCFTYLNGKLEPTEKLNERLEQINVREQEAIKQQMKTEANIQLQKSDLVAIRCIKANIPFPQEWVDYVSNLRDVINGKSESIIPMPE